MPIESDAIGIQYKIDLNKLSRSIQNAKHLLANFNKAFSELAKQASVKITVNDQSVNTAKTKVKKFTCKRREPFS